MNKIGLIINREYISRVKKKSFIIMTILGPILMAALIILPVVLTQIGEDGKKTIMVYDETGDFGQVLESDDIVTYKFIDTHAEAEKYMSNMDSAEVFGVLSILPGQVEKPELVAVQQPSMSIKMKISRAMETKIEQQKIDSAGLDKAILEALKSDVNIQTALWSDGGKTESSTEISMAIGFIAAIAIYMFVFLYGAQVMRGVMEEKTSRVVEVIISSVKPFELMMGKILGIALVVLTQFLVWIVLTVVIVGVVQTVFLDMDTLAQQQEQLTQMSGNDEINEQVAEFQTDSKAAEIMNKMAAIPFVKIILAFIFYFLGGYLLYSSLFAAIGAAVDNEADTQQFMLPITIPLILAFVMAQAIIEEPSGSIATWFSIIPFTSPIVMMVRLPFGVPTIDLVASMVLLVLTFIATTWMAAKIYRTGILMYGKKITYAELWKWLRYKG